MKNKNLKHPLVIALNFVFLIILNPINAQNTHDNTNDKVYKADQENGYYLNPILKGDYGDPSVLRDGKDYYMTNHMASMSIPQLMIWHSRDLVNWKPVGDALHEDLGGSVWAVDFIKYKDLYYIYMPVPSKNTNYVITAPHPSGPWSKAVDVGVSGIDPGHIATPEGKRYLHVDAGYMVELSDDGLKATTPKRKVYDGWHYPEDWVTECFCLESPKLNYHNGWYYMTVAQGGTAGPPTSHMVASARSKTPYGPWENSPYNPIVRNEDRNNKWASTGHGTLVDTPDGNWWIIFHGYENAVRSMGRQTLMLPVEWTSDGWFRVPEGIDIAKPIKMPKGEKVKGYMPMSDNFSGKEIGLQWKMLKSGMNDRVRLENNSLILKAEGDNITGSRPLMVDPMNNFYTVEVGVDAPDGSKGGIVLYVNSQKNLGLELENHTIYRLTGNGNREMIHKAKVWDKIRFRLVNDHLDLLYYYSTDDGRTWNKIDFGNNLEDFGQGTLRPALYAAGTSEVSFFNFIYRGMED